MSSNERKTAGKKKTDEQRNWGVDGSNSSSRSVASAQTAPGMTQHRLGGAEQHKDSGIART